VEKSIPLLKIMSEIEEINKLVTFGLVDGRLRILQVNADVWGDVKGDIQGTVHGDIRGDVEGSVEGYIGCDVGANVGRHVLGNLWTNGVRAAAVSRKEPLAVNCL
jgi:hypothetical protein